jgi:hypothetical protein
MSEHRPSVLLVGAGPAALAQALAFRCHGVADDLAVLDPSGRWFAAWDDRFRRQDIPHLRSPAVHHPHPDPFALLGAGGAEGLVPSGGTKLPTTARFARFVRNGWSTTPSWGPSSDRSPPRPCSSRTVARS